MVRLLRSAGVIALIVALAGCRTANSAPQHPFPAPLPVPLTTEVLSEGTAETWQVSVLRPTPLPSERCAEDPAVEVSVMSLDMPSSHVNYSLSLDATEVDALRIADCLASRLTGGTITVSPPR